MADSNSTECIEIDRVSWNKKRKGICLDGVWELDKIARTLPDLVTQDENQEYFIIRALAGRMLRITDMLMLALDDDAPNEELEKFVRFGHGHG